LLFLERCGVMRKGEQTAQMKPWRFVIGITLYQVPRMLEGSGEYLGGMAVVVLRAGGGDSFPLESGESGEHQCKICRC
jgi:hypothetical protein